MIHHSSGSQESWPIFIIRKLTRFYFGWANQLTKKCFRSLCHTTDFVQQWRSADEIVPLLSFVCHQHYTNSQQSMFHVLLVSAKLYAFPSYSQVRVSHTKCLPKGSIGICCSNIFTRRCPSCRTANGIKALNASVPSPTIWYPISKFLKTHADRKNARNRFVVIWILLCMIYSQCWSWSKYWIVWRVFLILINCNSVHW